MFRRSIACFVVAVSALVPLTQIATAGPPSKGFGPGIDGYPGYDGQSKCSPTPKPGVAAFARMAMKAYPGTGSLGISRACSIGGQSEHKEGRAFDWGTNAAIPYQRRAAESMIDWLTKPDGYGNDRAMVRRLGIMYIIFNRRIWFPWGGWETYCVQGPFGCHTPGDRHSIRDPHTSHVHFSFTWAGARKETTYWNKDRSMLGSIASPGLTNGYWLLARNGSVATNGTYFYGSLGEKVVKKPVVGMAARPEGDGYWLVSSNGRVSAYGDARYRGGAAGDISSVDDIVATPSGKGYWLITARGRVIPFGDAEYFGGMGGDGGRVVGMASTVTGDGYWLVTDDGRVTAFGAAQDLGGLDGKATDVEGIVASPLGGYWLFTSKGRVASFGKAQTLGGLVGETNQRIVDMAASSTGAGYWLMGEKGKVKSFGDALRAGKTQLAKASLPVPPAGLVHELPMD